MGCEWLGRWGLESRKFVKEALPDGMGKYHTIAHRLGGWDEVGGR